MFNVSDMVLKVTVFYGTLQLFISLAVIVLGAHLIVLASIEPDSMLYLTSGSSLVGASLFLILINLRKRM